MWQSIKFFFNKSDSSLSLRSSVDDYVNERPTSKIGSVSSEDTKEIISYDYITDPVFDSRFESDQMRCLALAADNYMKPTMKTFVLANKNVLCKFKLTGTNTTMTMLREVFGDDDSVKFGPTCTSGPLGGDAELVAIVCTENLGGCIYFRDLMLSQPHQADIECLSRQANIHNVLMMQNHGKHQYI